MKNLADKCVKISERMGSYCDQAHKIKKKANIINKK
jgi:hypothetical protein